MTRMRFTDQSVLVVGGSSGVGLAAAQFFAAEGAQVAVIGRPNGAGGGEVDRLRAMGHEASFFEADACSEPELSMAMKAARHRYGSPHVLYNNAGKAVVAPFIETSLSQWDELWRVNVISMVNSIRTALPGMLSRGGGSIVNMASISGLTASALESAYCTTKGACIQLTRSIAVEYRHAGIRCNAVCPGFIRTRHGLEELEAMSRRGVPFDEGLKALQLRMAEPEEVASCVLFLASQDAAFVNGACLTVDNAALAAT